MELMDIKYCSICLQGNGVTNFNSTLNIINSLYFPFQCSKVYPNLIKDFNNIVSPSTCESLRILNFFRMPITLK
jgi:hypothetical protein